MKTFLTAILVSALWVASAGASGNIYIWNFGSGAASGAASNATTLVYADTQLTNDVVLHVDSFDYDAGNGILRLKASVLTGATGGADWTANKAVVTAGAALGDTASQPGHEHPAAAITNAPWVETEADPVFVAWLEGGPLDDFLETVATGATLAGLGTAASPLDVTEGLYLGASDTAVASEKVVADGAQSWLAVVDGTAMVYTVAGAVTSSAPVMVDADVAALIAAHAGIKATTNSFGHVQIGSGFDVSDGVISNPGVSLYVGDGALDEDRTVTMDGNTLNLDGGVVSIDGAFAHEGPKFIHGMRVVSTLSGFEWTAGDYIIVVTSGGEQNLALPAAAGQDGRTLIIRNSTNAGTIGNIDLTTSIVGGPSTISPTGFVKLIADGGSWYTVSYR